MIYACVYNEPYETEAPEFIASSLEKAKAWCASGRPKYGRGVRSFNIVEYELDALTDRTDFPTWGWSWQGAEWRQYGPDFYDKE